MKSKVLQKILAVSMALAMTAGMTACGGKGEEPAPADTPAAKPAESEAPAADAGGSDSEQAGEEDFSILEGKTISFMTSQAKFFDAYNTMAEAIKADYGCEVEFQVIPDEEYDSLIKVKLSTSEVPDVYEANLPSLNEAYGAPQYCEDLSNEPWVARLVNPGLIKDIVDGKIYGMPKESSSGYQAVYYNKKVLADCGITDPQPKTYQEFLDLLKTVKEKGNGVVPFYQTNADTWTTQIFMTGGIACALGDKAVETTDKLLKNEIKWTDIPETSQVLQNYVDLYKDGYMNNDMMSVGYDTAAEAICTGKAAMYLTIEQWAADAMKKYPDCEMGSFVIPHADHALLPTGNYVQGLFVPKAGKQVDAVKAFLQVWSMPKYQNLYYEENPGFPAYSDVDGGDVVPVVQSLVDQYITTGNYVFEMNSLMAASSGINVDVWNYYIEALQGDKTPDEVFKAVQTDYVDYMEQQGAEGF
ncbi:ABC transporter substrate-binding protein [Diplocloster agilis]|uniref:ABC transporter substrate-binding protein n=1 Tax=Diplocloster agilis TaxID=2850323 RepID=UPI00082220D4|nr:extracellular solute-binding protein [Suonthocola fibrivorans]MCU6735730.1 extracellular solute-binding protein [Suonthocola fibrivorans]SCJ80550.1 Maltose-binding periplasmic proteins/domains [uncultured Clostridium sp.]